MSNYKVLDETNDYSDYYVTQDNNSKKSFAIIIALAVIFIIVIIIIKLLNSNSNSFSSYENKMVDNARSYITNNGISTNKEMYIDVSKLNVDLPSNCSMLSGVIYNGKDYVPYLLCKDYESKIVNNSDNIKLKGHDVMVLLKGTEYHELGYEGNEKIFISGEVDSIPGVYNVYYIPQIGNSMTTRKVIIIDNSTLINKLPVINTDTSSEITINVGDQYNDNTIAIDNIDGDLTKNIITVSDIDESIPGEYKVIYYVRNSLGYISMLTKKVSVVDNNKLNEVSMTVSLSNENITNQNIIANVKITGNNYNYVKLPDGTTTKENEFEYTISENGNYDFIVVLENGAEVSKSLNITNIDKTIPTGTCKALLYYNHTSVSVNISSFNYIVGYNYYINNKSSNFISHSTYNNTTEKNVNSVYVIAKDYIGNEGKIVCSTEKVSNFDPNGIAKSEYNNNQPRLRIPIETALAKKGTTVEALNKCIYDRVLEAGPYTRYGVAAAAHGLIDCMYKMTGYVLSYDHTGGKVSTGSSKNGGKIDYCAFNSDICNKLGVNRRWGKPGGSCRTSSCWYGLNCGNFVRWALCNGGMKQCSGGSADADMSSLKYIPEADGVYIKGRSVSYYGGTNLVSLGADALVRMIKPGDTMLTNEGGGHTFVVIGRDNNAIYTAEDGYYTRKITYSQMLSGKTQYRILFMDKYYDNIANRNNLYG